jgi:hypothetical protein
MFDISLSLYWVTHMAMMAMRYPNIKANVMMFAHTKKV